MTEAELIERRVSFRQNDQYKESTSPYKDCQLEQFSANGAILDGTYSRTDTINGKETLVIFKFKDGLIHSDDGLPAIEYPMHWEYWREGLIEKVVDAGGDTEELWKDGVPVKIKRNLSVRGE